MSASRVLPYRSKGRQPVEFLDNGRERFHRVAESSKQTRIAFTLLSSLKTLSKLRGWKRVHISSNNYFLWKKGDPTRCLSPDVFLIENAPEEIPDAWRLWEPDNPPPSWALEIVSNEWNKDYDLAPAKYEELGCQELVVFDPDAALGKTRNRRRKPLTVYRRTAEGRLQKIFEGAGPAWSQQLDLWLLPSREGYSVNLRLSEDEAGARLVPTEEESAIALERARQLDQAQFERALNLQRAAREAEQAAHDREVRLLEAQLREAKAKTATKRPRRVRKPKPGGK